MPSPEVDIATGASLSFTGLAALNAREILDFTPPEAAVETENISNQSTTGGHGKVAKDIHNIGSLILILHHFQDYDYFADIGTKAAVTMTMPSTATIVFTGILVRYTPQQATLNEKMTAEVEIEISNDVAKSETIVVNAGSGG